MCELGCENCIYAQRREIDEHKEMRCHRAENIMASVAQPLTYALVKSGDWCHHIKCKCGMVFEEIITVKPRRFWHRRPKPSPGREHRRPG